MSLATVRNLFSSSTFPENGQKLLRSRLYKQWWYYTVELLPGQIVQGVYPDNFPMLHRQLLRKLDLQGASCLDIGSMEGLIPTLMCRGGAKDVLAIDAEDHCREKMDAIKHYYGVDFDFQEVGLIYDLTTKLGEIGRGSFDVINLSGVLYHVYSPLMVMAGARALLKRNGYMIVSTNVVNCSESKMVFNDGGRLQEEANTFWYVSVPALEYMLRMLKLCPVDCLYVTHREVQSESTYSDSESDTGYLSVICRATEDVLPQAGDNWMDQLARYSWEHRFLTDWTVAARQPCSVVSCESVVEPALQHQDLESLDLLKAISHKQIGMTQNPSDAHILRLEDRE